MHMVEKRWRRNEKKDFVNVEETDLRSGGKKYEDVNSEGN